MSTSIQIVGMFVLNTIPGLLTTRLSSLATIIVPVNRSVPRSSSDFETLCPKHPNYFGGNLIEGRFVFLRYICG